MCGEHLSDHEETRQVIGLDAADGVSRGLMCDFLPTLRPHCVLFDALAVQSRIVALLLKFLFMSRA